MFPAYKHHLETYGPDFVYDDFIPLFTASKFNASACVELFVSAGSHPTTRSLFQRTVAPSEASPNPGGSTASSWNMASRGAGCRRRCRLGNSENLVSPLDARGLRSTLTMPGRGRRKVLRPHDEAPRRFRPVRYQAYQRSVVGSARSEEGFPQRADGGGRSGAAGAAKGHVFQVSMTGSMGGIGRLLPWCCFEVAMIWPGSDRDSMPEWYNPSYQKYGKVLFVSRRIDRAGSEPCRRYCIQHVAKDTLVTADTRPDSLVVLRITRSTPTPPNRTPAMSR
jgi:hypothetical protein